MRNIDFSNITFFQLQLCLSILEHGSCTRAAEACHISQPTLSKRLSELESQLGIILFIRGKNTKIRPTPAGEVILEEWKSILTQMEKALQKGYIAQANASPSVVVGCVPSMDVNIFLTPLVEGFAKKRPDADFRFVYDGAKVLVDGILSSEIDVVFLPPFRKSMLNRTSIKYTQVLTTEWYAGMLPTNPLAQKDHLTFEDLRQQRFILPSPQLFGDYYAFIEGMCEKYGYSPNASFYTNNHMSLSVNVRADDEVFLVDGFSLLLHDTGCRFVKMLDTKSGIIMAHSMNNDRPIIRDFLHFASGFFRNFHEHGQVQQKPSNADNRSTLPRNILVYKYT